MDYRRDVRTRRIKSFSSVEMQPATAFEAAFGTVAQSLLFSFVENLGSSRVDELRQRRGLCSVGILTVEFGDRGDSEGVIQFGMPAYKRFRLAVSIRQTIRLYSTALEIDSQHWTEASQLATRLLLSLSRNLFGPCLRNDLDSSETWKQYIKRRNENSGGWICRGRFEHGQLLATALSNLWLETR
ncbi:hypothetical protein TNCV_1098121 [Trichonephila clavipes]|nr:hypothetical protein TNCV_1098121 [Trichonephila clavipes]